MVQHPVNVHSRDVVASFRSMRIRTALSNTSEIPFFTGVLKRNKAVYLLQFLQSYCSHSSGPFYAIKSPSAYMTKLKGISDYFFTKILFIE